MGLWKTTRCPVCNTTGARTLLWMVKCPNRDCAKYDAGVAFEAEMPRAGGSRPERVLRGDFDPGANRIEVRYRNHAGEEKTYVGDKTTVRRRGNHLSLCLVPTGVRCAFDRDRIRNVETLDPLVSEEEKLDPVERQILGYHRARGTTSPRYEAVLRKLNP